jgi:23S rRNA pseudouridine2605 synthase
MPIRDPEDLPPPAPKLVRLQRYLASCGLGSRRACEDFITMGRVTVDGKVITEQGMQIDPQVNKIALDGEKLKMERKKYYVFNKPPGVLCTNKDPEGRPRVIDYFPKEGPRVFTVGRLDEDSEGLLIVTNDGDLAQKMAHPSYRIFRTYHVLVAGFPTPETLTELRNGIYFEEGRFRVEGVKSIKKQGQSTWCEVILAEGHNREVRRLFSRVGHKVMKLQRVAFGPIFLGKMLRGDIREMRRDELERLLGMLVRNEEARDEEIEKRGRPAFKSGQGTRRQNDGDLLNKSSRNAPPERNRPSTGKAAPGRPSASGPTVRKGPPIAPPRRVPDAISREPRGLGVEDVSDEQMMGLTDRPAGRSPSAGFPKKSASAGGRSQGRPTEKRVAGAFGDRKAADAKIRAAEAERLARRALMFPAKYKTDPATDDERAPSRPFQAAPADGPRRPAKAAPFKTAKGSSLKAGKGSPTKAAKSAKRKGPGRSDKPTESFGRRSPGQPKRPKGSSPRGR